MLRQHCMMDLALKGNNIFPFILDIEARVSHLSASKIGLMQVEVTPNSLSLLDNCANLIALQQECEMHPAKY